MYEALSSAQTLSTFHYTLLDKCQALLSVVEKGWPNALDFSFDLELNIPRLYYLMNNSFMECFVHYSMNSNCTCVRSTMLDNFALDQTSLDKLQSSRLHSTRWPNALDISLNMYVERCIVKNRERLAGLYCYLLMLLGFRGENNLQKICHFQGYHRNSEACPDLCYFKPLFMKCHNLTILRDLKRRNEC